MGTTEDPHGDRGLRVGRFSGIAVHRIQKGKQVEPEGVSDMDRLRSWSPLESAGAEARDADGGRRLRQVLDDAATTPFADGQRHRLSRIS